MKRKRNNNVDPWAGLSGDNSEYRKTMQKVGKDIQDSDLFDSFDFGSLSDSEQRNDHDFSLFHNSPLTQQTNFMSQFPSPVPEDNTYTSLLSPPNFSKYLQFSQIEKHVQISDIGYGGQDISYLLDQAKDKSRRSRRAGTVGSVSSQHCRTFQSRLETFRPYIQCQIASRQEWNQAKIFANIGSITPDAQEHDPNVNVGDGEGQEYAWDEMQGICFKEFSEPIVLIGFIFKVAPAKSTTMDRLCRRIGALNIDLKPVVKPCLFLQDSTAKIRLELGRQSCVEDRMLKLNSVVSGVPIAIRGMCLEGKLWVEDVLFATPPPPAVPLACIPNEVDMVFVSGLNIGQYTDMSAIDLLFGYLQGLSGSELEQESIMNRITRVIFLGNLFAKPEQWNPDRREELIQLNCDIANKIDYYLTGLTRTTEVFIVPGENDPTHEMTIPQPPLHKRLFPASMQHSTLRCLTNPAKVCFGMSNNNMQDNCDENVMNLVLSSGMNVKKTMEDCPEINRPLEMCSKLLEWSHLYPSSIDGGEIAEELLSLSTLPHLFVVGGESQFKIKEWNGVKIVSVPSFSSTGKVVVMTKTLRKNCVVTPLSFKICTT